MKPTYKGSTSGHAQGAMTQKLATKLSLRNLTVFVKAKDCTVSSKVKSLVAWKSESLKRAPEYVKSTTATLGKKIVAITAESDRLKKAIGAEADRAAARPARPRARRCRVAGLRAMSGFRVEFRTPAQEPPPIPVRRAFRTVATPRSAAALVSASRTMTAEQAAPVRAGRPPRAPATAPGRRWHLAAGLAPLCATVVALAAWQGPPPAGAAPHASPSSRSPDPAAATAPFARLALNALLVPLMDDHDPPVWTDVALRHVCDATTRVEVDGRPLQPGTAIPATGFRVRWHIGQCWPFDYAAVELSGTVDLLVFHEDDGLGAVVDAARLRIASATGTARIAAPFAAAMQLGSAPIGSGL